MRWSETKIIDTILPIANNANSRLWPRRKQVSGRCNTNHDWDIVRRVCRKGADSRQGLFKSKDKRVYPECLYWPGKKWGFTCRSIVRVWRMLADRAFAGSDDNCPKGVWRYLFYPIFVVAWVSFILFKILLLSLFIQWNRILGWNIVLNFPDWERT